MTSFFFGALAALSLSASQPQPYEQAYLDFQAAVEAGDAAAIRRHAEEAWRLAENALGAGETTAILAQNYLWEVIWADPAGSGEIAGRALELGEQGYGLDNMTLAELRVADAAAQAAADPRDNRKLDRLVEATSALPVAVGQIGIFADAAHRLAALLAYEDGRYDLTFELSERIYRAHKALGSEARTLVAIDLMRAAALMSARNRFNPSSYRGSARIRPAYERQLNDAHVILANARESFPPQLDLDSFDPLLAQVEGWRNILRAFAESVDADLDEGHVFEGRGIPQEPRPLFAGKEGRRAQGECEIPWTKRVPPDFPSRFALDGFIGAVIIGFEFGPDGRPARSVVLSEVPSGRFSPLTLEAFDQWTADPARLDPDCLGPHLTVIRFIEG